MPINLNDEHPDDALLEDARMNADSEWAEEFIVDLLKLRRKLGANFSLSDRQRELVERIAEHGK